MKTVEQGLVTLALAVAFAAGAALAGPPSQPTFLGPARPKQPVKRLVSLAPNLTEIVFALGAGERVVGVTRYDDYPPQVEQLPEVGGFLDPSLEVIAGLKPDLVVCVPNSGNRERMRGLSRLSIPVLVLPAYAIDDVYRAIAELGRWLECESRSAELVADMKRRAARVARRVAELKRPRVLLVYGHRPLVAAGPGSFADWMIRSAGAENVLSNAKVRYPKLPLEAVLELAPEVIVDASASGSGASMEPAEVRGFWRRWQVIPAVRHDRIHQFDSALWFRPGPRLVQGLERLTVLLHPEIEALGAERKD